MECKKCKIKTNIKKIGSEWFCLDHSGACTVCGSLKSRDNLISVHSRVNRTRRVLICKGCVDNNAYYCERCKIYSTSYKRCCKSSLVSGNPSKFNTYKFDDKDNDMFFGIELENAGIKDVDLVSIRNITKELAWTKTDSSLNSGYEMVTHPCTYKFHKKIFPWKEIFNLIKEYSTQNCGLHIHVNRNALNSKNKAYQKLMFLVHKHYNDLIRISGRNNNDVERWTCRHYDFAESKLNSFNNADEYYEWFKIANKSVSHTKIISISRSETYELRLFHSPTKYEDFMGMLELYYHLIKVVNRTPMSTLLELSFEEIMRNKSFKYLNDLLTSRGGYNICSESTIQNAL